ncbi:MAG: hsp70 family protein [Desulfobacterales bacterium]|nr:MAG: hsp70 family protein [Desulfobacterales bacterium]
MALEDIRFIIGIDLGTTNSAVSYVDLQAEPGKKAGALKKAPIKLFKVPQLTGLGEIMRLAVLPSFLYIPGTYDIAPEAVVMPWDDGGGQGAPRNFVGALARDHGAKIPGRLVSSAKSWLCHHNADRKARILPWGARDEVRKISPVQATASYLQHIKNAWNTIHIQDREAEENLALENQMIIITVPASFDEVARDLTLEAAALAGLPNVTLLEEPLAAFYSWLIRHEAHWQRFVQPNELILVCDVGGGTTDFTLITLREVEGSPRFERIAVGDHLILGGDNMDLALARRVEMGLGKNKVSLTGDRWKTLCHQCRQAKEIILDGKAEARRITLMGEGGRLIAGTLAAELDRPTVEATVLEGFFPLVEPHRMPPKMERKGITEFGLPYEQEPAIKRHLGWFLEQHRADVAQVLNKAQPAPDLILFNGGSLKPPLIQERIRAAIRHWFQEEDPRLPRVLENPAPDLAVALGASYYGLVKIGKGVRVGSGSARAYFLGVAKREETPGAAEEKRHALCLVERGLEEGRHIELQEGKFEVLANQPVSFDIYSSSFRSGDRCGDLVEVDDSLTPLPPIQTVIQYGKKGRQTRIPVQIEVHYTEIGTLALWCRSLTSNHRWQLQFQLREAPEPAGVSEAEVLEASLVEDVRARVQEVFAAPSEGVTLEHLVKEISGIVDRPRETWPLGLIRSMADELLALSHARSISPEYESRWLNLTGFCLRPGFGDGFDEYRLQKLWPIHKQGPIYAKKAQVRSEWWIMWRRVAGGLKSGYQRQFIQDLTPVIMSAKGAKIPPQERLEIWMAVANMERLLVKDKIRWGRQLLAEIRPKKSKPQHFWSLARIGARELLYGPVDRVIPPQEAAAWIEAILSQEWRNPKPVGAALAQMARKTGDRMRDLEPAVLKRTRDWLAANELFSAHLKYLDEVVPLARAEESTIFGESLPMGLVLHA